ncbi:MAG: glucosidase, partial [Actinomycetota bacterium]|nr:glucosidase [Actinomycetota bacterium]
MIESLDRYGRYFHDHLRVEHPVGSGRQLTLGEVADDLARRLVSIFLRDADGRRPVGGAGTLSERPGWTDQIWFHEYFHGDTGAGLGASHQTGWTGLVLDLIADRRLGGRR